MKKHYGVYKIINLLTGKFYIGSHSTNDLNDSYMGSSRYLNEDIEYLGIENFKREWIFLYDTKEEMVKKEEELIKEEFNKENKNVYNIRIDGGWNTSGLISVKPANGIGKGRMMDKNDPRYLNGEYVSLGTGNFIVIDENGKTFRVNKTDIRYISGEVISTMKGLCRVKDLNNNSFLVDKNDPRIKTGEYTVWTKGFAVVRYPGESKHFMVDKNDPRIKTGELVHIWKDRKHTEEVRKTIGEKNSISQKGERNSSYGNPWIYNEELKQNKKISLEELDTYLIQGWKKGRKMKF